jgi:hypothetical protein
MTPESTGSGTGTITEPAQATSTTVQGLVRRAGEVRDEVQVVGQDAEGLHGELRIHALDARTSELAQRDPTELLRDLSAAYGVSWTLIAKLLSVSQTSVRKWRRGEAITPENRRAIARVVAFLQTLQEAVPNMCDPASWLEMRISDEATLTPADLYLLGRYELLLDLAGLHYAPHEVLYAVDPRWRDRYAPDNSHQVIIAPDGQPSIIVRDEA